jgi:hypothetical protein
MSWCHGMGPELSGMCFAGECVPGRCDERLKTKSEKSTRHWVDRGTGTPKDKDEVNRVMCVVVVGKAS